MKFMNEVVKFYFISSRKFLLVEKFNVTFPTLNFLKVNENVKSDVP
jgi:hypothetical protein